MKSPLSFRLVILLIILAALATYAYSSHCPTTKTSCRLTSVAKVSSGIKITDAKMATALDEKLMPVQVTDVFPRDTRKVFCWFAWDNATPKMEMQAKWNYVVDDIHILSYDFRIPRKKGSGGISIIMPSGKVLPVGSYRIDLVVKNKTLKSLTFKVK